jgi:hypothetical protein
MVLRDYESEMRGGGGRPAGRVAPSGELTTRHEGRFLDHEAADGHVFLGSKRAIGPDSPL